MLRPADATRPGPANDRRDDADDLRPFLTTLYGDAVGLVAGFSGVRRQPNQKRLAARTQIFVHWPTDAPAIARWVRVAASQVGREVYLAVRLFGGRRRTARDPTPVRTLFVDGDGAGVPAWLPAPTLALETSPGRHQFLFVLATPVPPDQARALSARLARAIGGDPSGADLTQLLRVPGTRNWKYDPAPLVRVVGVGDRWHDPVALDRLLPPPPRSAARSPPAMPHWPGRAEPLTVDAASVRLHGHALAVWAGCHPVIGADGAIDRSASLWVIAKDLVRSGASGALLAGLLAERDRTLGYHKATGRADGGWYRRLAEHAAAAVAAEPALDRPTSWHHPARDDPRVLSSARQTADAPPSGGDLVRPAAPRASYPPTPPGVMSARHGGETPSPPGIECNERSPTMFARSLSRITLVGHVGREADLRYLPSGTATATFSVAVNRTTRDVEGQRAEAVDWFRVIAWEALGAWCGEHLTTGARVLIEGRMENRRYTDRDGIERTAWEVRAHEVIILDAPREPTATTQPESAPDAAPVAPAPPVPPTPTVTRAQPTPAGRPAPPPRPPARSGHEAPTRSRPTTGA